MFSLPLKILTPNKSLPDTHKNLDKMRDSNKSEKKISMTNQKRICGEKKDVYSNRKDMTRNQLFRIFSLQNAKACNAYFHFLESKDNVIL